MNLINVTPLLLTIQLNQLTPKLNETCNFITKEARSLPCFFCLL